MQKGELCGALIYERNALAICACLNLTLPYFLGVCLLVQAS